MCRIWPGDGCARPYSYFPVGERFERMVLKWNNEAMKTFVFMVAVSVLTVPTRADTFGTGDNQFTIEFVTISGTSNPAGGYGVIAYDYRIGKFEITAEQWHKAGFPAASGQDSSRRPPSPGSRRRSLSIGSTSVRTTRQRITSKAERLLCGLPTKRGTGRTSSATRTLIIFSRPRTNGSRPPTGTAHHFKRGHRQITRSPFRALIRIMVYFNFPRGPSAAAARNATRRLI